ncbi:MAG: hypothetical protein ACRD2R_06145, partial [Terriglobales bacterium]
MPKRLRKAGGTPVTVREVCEFIIQTLTQTLGAPPLWLRLEPRYAFALNLLSMTQPAPPPLATRGAAANPP